MKKRKMAALMFLGCALVLSGCGSKGKTADSETEKMEATLDETISEAGTYTGEYEIVTIVAEDTILENAKADKIIVTKEVGDGDVILKNVEVNILEIYGGGENSIHLQNTIAENVISHKEEGIVRIVAEKSTKVQNFDATNTIIVIKEGAQAAEVMANANTEVIIEQEAAAEAIIVADETAKVTVEGIAGSISLEAPKTTVVLTETSAVTEIKVTENAERTVLVIDGLVERVEVQASTEMDGTGKVQTIEAAGEDLIKAAENSTVIKDSQKAQEATKKPTHNTVSNQMTAEKPADTTAIAPIPSVPEKEEEKKEEKPAPHTHRHIGTVTTAATCGKEGVEILVCECGDSYTKPIAATGKHEYVNYICSECGEIDPAATIVVDQENKTAKIYSADGLFEFAERVNNEENFSNYTVTLEVNVDLQGRDWIPINGWNGIMNNLTFDGQNFVISNMKVTGVDEGGFIVNNASKLTIKNLTFEKAYVQTADGNNKYAGILIGKTYSPITFEQVKVKDSQVRCTWQAGGYIGFGELTEVDYKNCVISDSFVGGANCTAGILFGLGKTNVSVEQCSAENIELYTDMAADWVGYLYGHQLTSDSSIGSSVKVVTDYPQ